MQKFESSVSKSCVKCASTSTTSCIFYFSFNLFTIQEAQNLVNFLRMNQTCFPVDIISVVTEQAQQLSELIHTTDNQKTRAVAATLFYIAS